MEAAAWLSETRNYPQSCERVRLWAGVIKSNADGHNMETLGK